MKLSREGVLLIAICIADLATTLWLVYSHGAQEANPFMRHFLERSVLAFIMAKAVFCLAPLALIEWARSRNPLFCRSALRTGIGLYLGLYAVGVWKINQNPTEPIHTVVQTAPSNSEGSLVARPEMMAALPTHPVDF